jgi:hypothetical protein
VRHGEVLDRETTFNEELRLEREITTSEDDKISKG